MDYNNSDIIIARATPIGSSALAVIRISGRQVIQDVPVFFSIKSPKPRYAHVGIIKSPNTNEAIDRCVLTYFKNPKSYTGEEMIEISCHGGDGIVETIIGELVSFGYRLAYPGEFSYRAFKNNKLDLMQVESVAEKITSKTKQYGVLLQNMEDGVTSNKMYLLRENIVTLLSVIEHELDFNEDEITHLNHQGIVQQLTEMRLEINIIIKHSQQIKQLDVGYRVMIVGYPNVGKSTLFNYIAGQDKAIITPIKGTTRDILETKIKINNIPITLYDTAGYRNTKNKIELLGIQKSLKLLQDVDAVLIVDQKNPIDIKTELRDKKYISDNKTIILVQNKCDNIQPNKVYNKEKNIYQISAKNGIGINKILTKLCTALNSKTSKGSYENVIVCNKRQIKLLEDGMVVISNTLDLLEDKASMDVVASELKNYIDIMDELLGRFTSNEILNKIFKGFCVGK